MRCSLFRLFHGEEKMFILLRQYSHAIFLFILIPSRFITAAIRTAALVSLTLLLASCGRDDDSFVGKAYHNFTAFFNPYYNARIEYDRGIQSLQSTDKYDRNSPLEIFPSVKNAATARQNFDRVVNKCAIILQAHTVSALADNALLLMGKAYFYQENFQAAERKFKEILTNYPEGDIIDEATFWYGRTLAEQRQTLEAREVLGNVLSSAKTTDPVKGDAHFSLAEMAILELQYDVAIKEIELGLPFCKDHDLKARATFVLARLYDLLRDFPNAARMYQAAINLDPSYEIRYAAEISYAVDLRKQRKIKEAMKFFEIMLDDDKNFDRFAEIRYELAECFVIQDRLGKAIDLYIEIIRKSPKTEPSAKSYYELGKIKQFISGDFETARAFYDSARAEFPQGKIRLVADTAFTQLDKVLALYEACTVLDSTIRRGIVKVKIKIDSTEKPDSAKVDDEFARRPRRLYRKSVVLALGIKDVFGEMSFGVQRETRARFSVPPPTDTLTLIKYRRDLLEKTVALGSFYHLTLPIPDSAVQWYRRALVLSEDTSYAYSDSINTLVQAAIPPIAYSLADVYTALADGENVDTLYRFILTRYPTTLYAARVRDFYKIPQPKDSVLVDKVLYTAAYALMDSNKHLDALHLLDSIIVRYPSSRYRPRAILSSAYLYQENLKQNDSAITRYRLLASLYPSSPEARSVSATLEALKVSVKKDSLSDSLSAGKLMKPDSAAVAMDSLRRLDSLLRSRLAPPPAPSGDTKPDPNAPVPPPTPEMPPQNPPAPPPERKETP
jgi:TolA-binding protein